MAHVDLPGPMYACQDPRSNSTAPVTTPRRRPSMAVNDVGSFLPEYRLQLPAIVRNLR